MATEEGNSRMRRMNYRETREEFIKAFNAQFPGDSINPETSFNEPFLHHPTSGKRGDTEITRWELPNAPSLTDVNST